VRDRLGFHHGNLSGRLLKTWKQAGQSKRRHEFNQTADILTVLFVRCGESNVPNQPTLSLTSFVTNM
jgi:hypothetical protein